MKLNLFKIFLLNFLILFGLQAHSQKNIIIDEELATNSEPMKVKIGGQGFGKISKWKFGEFSVVQSKNGWTTTKSKSNFFNTKTESKSSHKFSFILCNSNTDSALVNVAVDMETKALQGFELFSGFTIGSEVILLENRNFTATININSDTTDTWLLLMNTSVGSDSENSGRAVLLASGRKIIIISATSNKNGTDSRSLPALGYEFLEDDHSISAVQYYGGGVLGMNKNMVWINNNQSRRMKLILAAAITAIMQKELDSISSMN
jgi:hypothetical protein